MSTCCRLRRLGAAGSSIHCISTTGNSCPSAGSLICYNQLRTMISFGQSYSLPPRHVASTSKHKKLFHVSCVDRRRSSYVVGTCSSGAGVGVRCRSERVSSAAKNALSSRLSSAHTTAKAGQTNLYKDSFLPLMSRPRALSPLRRSSTFVRFVGLKGVAEGDSTCDEDSRSSWTDPSVALEGKAVFGELSVAATLVEFMAGGVSARAGMTDELDLSSSGVVMTRLSVEQIPQIC